MLNRSAPLVVSAVLAAIAVSLALFGSPTAVPAADKEKSGVEKVEYKGWKNNLRLTNGEVELIITLDVGPRIISYRYLDGKNVFKEYPDQLGKTGEKEWQIRGGHRLWVGPEDLTRTYALDNGPVEYKELESGHGVRVLPAPDSEYGIQKEIDVRLDDKGSHVRLVHRLRNIGDKETRLAPWVLSVMDAGGVEVIPLPPHHPHPGPPKNAKSPKDFAPNLTVVLWPFFDFKDPRWTFGTKYITLRQDPEKGPTKIGLSHELGWVGYLNHGTLFVKRFGYEERKHYPDRGSNFETFTNPDMLEIESLGPLVHLAAGKAVEHVEDWELVKDVEEFKDEADIDAKILPRVKAEK